VASACDASAGRGEDEARGRTLERVGQLKHELLARFVRGLAPEEDEEHIEDSDGDDD